MYNSQLHQQVNAALKRNKIDIAGADNAFYVRMIASAATMQELYNELYARHPAGEQLFHQLIDVVIKAYVARGAALKRKDDEKAALGDWFLSNDITGMSLYVDRFCGNLKNLGNKLDYFEKLGVNFLHLLPIFESPEGESDGGYAVSDFRKVDKRFGTMKDLGTLQQKMIAADMYLMVDIVLNHTSSRHEWAEKAKQGDAKYQDYFYMYDADSPIPEQFERHMPEIFPESSPGNFTFVPECNKWVMTVFHGYQWDLNYTNPAVFVDMVDTVLFYANLGVDILRIDAPIFIWKQLGTICQNLPETHTILRLIKQCVLAATPGMALLAEAIAAPKDIMKYFGTGLFKGKECDFAYNATQMALQWDMLATGTIRVMLGAQHDIAQKPHGATWITYTRCHDDIGLAYDDNIIRMGGFEPYEHRRFLWEYYSGKFPGSPSTGALFSVNPKTGDARISGSLAAMCGLEKASAEKDQPAVETALSKILLMQAHSFFLGGVPMLFYGDELGYTNDYSYLTDPGKSYDNRWMHRPVIDWKKNKLIDKPGTAEQRIFAATQKLISIRRKLPVVADHSNITWLAPYNIHVAGYLRQHNGKQLFCVFNFSAEEAFLTWYAFREHNNELDKVYDHWAEREFTVGSNEKFLIIEPYGFHLFEVV
ncbi:alpha-amylase [Mucilaginibacter sp. ZT4R22]|uniref:Alpha-amylase n=1 Tax=Mucilaginibacter pankratovii TaxID=2772110 RepID=A0ABR7WLX9_9SPHI|nr:alpha-amylase family glycosyl hydrolase [Mucilaginibacter pankratovii]MBD1363330.1 alpha-amylase [Mucilaginibacter pankratovii]